MTSPTADHHDAGKPAVEFLPPRASMAVGQVMGYGELKYPRKIPDEPNYLHGVGVTPLKLLGSTLRHCFRYMAGEWLDQESGLPHLAHAAADAMMALEVELKRGRQ